MDKNDFLSLVKEIADDKISALQKAGFAQPGHNGPYLDQDTPIRNSAHWLCTYSCLYRLYGEPRYLQIVKTLAQYILREEHYGKNGAVVFRNNKVSDSSNGIIGPAWVIEALIEAAKTLHDDQYYEKARQLFLVEKFDENLRLWKIADIDGSVVSIDYVYNHQVWFAASGSMICAYRYNAEIDRQVSLFLDNYKRNLFVQPSGLLFHQVNFDYSAKGTFKKKMRALLCDLSIGGRMAGQKKLEKGYQLFDLYGLALLRNRYEEKAVFQDPKILKAVRYGLTSQNIRGLCTEKNINQYGFAYNSPAFEAGYVALAFLGGFDPDVEALTYDLQYHYFYDSSTKMFAKNTKDPETLTARVYEWMRYYEVSLKEN